MADSIHAFFSDGFVLAVANNVDMKNWDGVAFLLTSGTTQATMQMADDSGFTVNLTTVVEADRGQSIIMPAGATAPFWLEVFRPTKRYVQVTGATGPVYAFQYHHTGNMPIRPGPNRMGGRGS